MTRREHPGRTVRWPVEYRKAPENRFAAPAQDADAITPWVPNNAASPYASPLRADVSGLPPATVITAGFDPLRDQGAADAERLCQAGVAVDCANYPDMAHEFFGMGAVVDGARAAVQQVGRTLRAVFGQ